MIKEAIKKIVENIDLSQNEMEEVMTGIMQGEVTPAQIAAFITGIRC